MDYRSLDSSVSHDAGDAADLRAAPRYTSLIRAAKLVSSQGEFVCVIRDVSRLGIGLRLFHNLPIGDALALELQNGDSYELHKVRDMGREASFTFARPVCVDQLIRDSGSYPRRQLRLGIAMPLSIQTISGSSEAISENISQQGCRIECEDRFAIDQNVRLSGEGFPEVRAKVRWRKENSFGLVFENTFTLGEFAVLAARLQCPSLLSE